MGFLFPLYLLGAVAVALPIYLHLRRKPPKDSVEFSSLMFLEPTKHQPVKRRSQLENWPLLLLRCLALLALVTIFGRPFFAGEEGAAQEETLRTVLVIDTSASLRREGLWDKATDAADEVIRGLEGKGELAILTSDSRPSKVMGFQDWEDSPSGSRVDLATGAIEALEPTWESTDLGAGLLAAAEIVADAAADDEADSPSEIVVVTDLQSGADLDAVAGATWPEGLAVRLITVEPDGSTNSALSVAPTVDESKVAVRVRNDPASERSEFSLLAGDTTRDAFVPPGESRVFEFDAGTEKVTLLGDDHDFDNTLYLVPRGPAPVDLLFMGEGDPDDSNAPEYYFRRAFGLSKVLKPNYVETLAENPSVIAVARPLDTAETADLRRVVENGGRALLVLTGTDMAPTLAALTGMTPPPELTERDRDYVLLQSIDFDHPSLREFRDPRWRDFTGVHFWRNRALDPSDLPENAQILAMFDSGTPAWFEVPVGEGSVFVMAAGWHPRDSQLALSSKFLPLLFSVFADVAPRVGSASQFFIGDSLPLGPGETLAGGAPEKPGVYQTTGGAITRYFAVNQRPAESELSPLPLAALDALGIPLAGAAPEPLLAEDTEKTVGLRGKQSEARQNLWRSAVLILLGLLAVESWLASRVNQPVSHLTS